MLKANKRVRESSALPQCVGLCSLVLAFALLLSACGGVTQLGAVDLQSAWKPNDVVSLDPADTPDPGADILAAYLRIQQAAVPRTGNSQPRTETHFPHPGSERITIRLDVLDLRPEPGADYALALDYATGGSTAMTHCASAGLAWDLLIRIPSAGDVSAFRPDGSQVRDLRLSVWRDPVYDFLTVSFDPAALPMPIPARLRIQAASLDPGTECLLDSTSAARPADPAPQPVRYVLAFRNAYPAYTPAQALRRWDGAHTGPLGGRHGLYNLLRIARNYAVPLLLADLNDPASLSALDYAGDLQLVRELHAQQLLLLPSSQASVIADEYRLGGDSFWYLDARNLVAGDGYTQIAPLFASLYAPSQLGSPHVLAIDFEQLSAGNAPQPDLSGIALDTRHLLAAGAGGTILLGGDLPASAWGAPEYARAALAYLKAHPWLQPARRYDLLELPSTPVSIPGVLNTDAPQSPDPGPDLAYAQALQSLNAPLYPSPQGLDALRRLYRDELDNLQAAIQWQRQPFTLASCSAALEREASAYCILASDSVFALLDPRSGGLVFLFVRSGDEVHQLVGPGWQFSLGGGDPAGWDLTAGAFADPDAVPAAFARKATALIVEEYEGSLAFSDAGNRITYSLAPAGLIVDMLGDDYAQTSLPLALDPWTRFMPGWGERYAATSITNGYRWQITGALAMSVTGDAKLSMQAFNDSRDAMGGVENPNREYPPGHYLPFPMALVKIRAQDSARVRIQLIP